MGCNVPHAAALRASVEAVRRGRSIAVGMVAWGLGLAAPAATHTGHGVVPVTVEGFAFKPATVEVVEGDAVSWTYSGLDRDHSVTFDDGSYDSDPAGRPDHPQGDVILRGFGTPGTFTYRCKVHGSMRGTVVVRPAPAVQAPAGPSLGRLGIRPSKPCLRRSRTCRRPGFTVRFRLGSPADLTLTVWRADRRGRPVGDALVVRTVDGRAGTNAIRVPVTRLRAGRHVVEVTAADGDGNVGGPRSKTVTLAR